MWLEMASNRASPVRGSSLLLRNGVSGARHAAFLGGWPTLGGSAMTGLVVTLGAAGGLAASWGNGMPGRYARFGGGKGGYWYSGALPCRGPGSVTGMWYAGGPDPNFGGGRLAGGVPVSHWHAGWLQCRQARRGIIASLMVRGTAHAWIGLR